jgi:hypothetical protein
LDAVQEALEIITKALAERVDVSPALEIRKVPNTSISSNALVVAKRSKALGILGQVFRE